VLDPAEAGNDIDAKARGVDRFDNADRLLQHVGRHGSSAQHSHSAGFAHCPHQWRGCHECHAGIDEWNP
jgi:hypothetical protein